MYYTVNSTVLFFLRKHGYSIKQGAWFSFYDGHGGKSSCLNLSKAYTGCQCAYWRPVYTFTKALAPPPPPVKLDRQSVFRQAFD